MSYISPKAIKEIIYSKELTESEKKLIDKYVDQQEKQNELFNLYRDYFNLIEELKRSENLELTVTEFYNLNKTKKEIEEIVKELEES